MEREREGSSEREERKGVKESSEMDGRKWVKKRSGEEGRGEERVCMKAIKLLLIRAHPLSSDNIWRWFVVFF